MYHLIRKEGPARHRSFTSEVILENKAVTKGQGRIKKESEQKAAEGAHHKLKDENK